MTSFTGAATRGLTALAVLFAALSAASTAHAATPEERATAHEQLTQAQDLKKQGQLAEALSHFEESERLDPKLTTLLDLADCAEQLGKLVEAQAYWAAARDMAKHDEKPQSKTRAEQRLAAIDKRLPHLTLQLAADAPAGTQVFRDDVQVESASLGTALPLNPGDHAIVVKLAGHDDAKYLVTVAEGDSPTLPVTAGPAIPPPAPPPPPPPKVVAPPITPEASSSSGSGRRTAGIVLGAGGIVGIGAGSLLWNTGYRNGNSLGPTADQQLLAGQILVISGGVLLVTGIVLFATAPSGESPKNANARMPVTPTLTVGRGAAVLGAAGAF